MQRLMLGLAVAAVAALPAAPASAGVEVQHCYMTVVVPCGVCVDEGPVDECVSLR